MAKPPKVPKFDLETVRGITVGPEAQSRKRHNKHKPPEAGRRFDLEPVKEKLDSITNPARRPNKQRPGEIYSAKTPPPEHDRLDRALIRASEEEQRATNKRYEGKPRPGEVLTAKEGPDEEQREKDRVKAFIALAMRRFRLASEAENENRKDALDDLKFLTGEQWTPDVKNQRELDGRPCLTMNRLPQFVRQVTNEQRQQRPAIQVNPVGDGADTDTADVLQGMVRHIEVNSDAEIAYDSAFEQMVGSGFKGYIRVCSDYINDGTDAQELLIRRVKNSFTVYCDPSAVEADESDAKWKFVVDDMPISEYKEEFPGTEAASLTDCSSIGDSAPDWATKDSIRVAEYWYVKKEERRIAYLQDGTEVNEDAVPEGAVVQNWRTVTKKIVRCATINAIEVIKEYEWPGSIIPLVPVIGDDYDVDGKRKLSGLVRYAKDPQRMRNYWVSAATEMIALAPKAPFIVAEGQLENHETEWRDANRRNLSVLQYKPVDAAGKPAPPPQRTQFEPQIQSLVAMIAQAENDMKATTGIYDASLGEKGPDQSGRAILARQKQSDVATLNFSDNLARALRCVGRILIEAIPHFYDTPRVQRIIHPDSEHEMVGIYSSKNPTMSGVNVHMLAQMQSVKKIYDIGVGRYDVTVSVGPSYQSKRQEAVASMLEFMRVSPTTAPIVADLVARNSDWNGSKEIAERLKKMLPPQLQDDQDDPEVQAQKYKNMLQQAMQQHDAAIAGLKKAEEIINTKQLEQQTKVEIAKMDNMTKVAVAEIQTKAQDARMRREFEFEEFKLMQGGAHDVGMERMQHIHALQQGAQASQQAQDLAAQQAENQPTAAQ